MMKNGLLILSVSAALLLSSCHRNEFGISGTIIGDNTDGKMVYLEYLGLKGIEVLDSVKLSNSGQFKFFSARPEYPDLYQIRFNGQRFVFSVDSTERISISANENAVSFPQVIEGSRNSEVITELRKSLKKMQTAYSNNDIDLFKSQVALHRHFADSVIMGNTHSIAAYYAVFQRVGEYYVYNPYVKSDRVYCAAVATGFKAYMPLYERSRSIELWVLSALQDEKHKDNILSIQEMVDSAEDAVLDISLPDKNGDICKLSDLKGKVVLLDFSAAAMDNNAAYILELRELYNRYKKQGFEIYQVSADKDENLWKRSVENLPWLCVRETKSSHSSAFVTYNVYQLPTMFVINRKGQVVSRHTDFKTISSDIANNLK